MPVWAPSRCGSIRIVATTRISPLRCGKTFTSPNGSTTFFNCAIGFSTPLAASRSPSRERLYQILPDALSLDVQHEKMRAGWHLEIEQRRPAGIGVVLDHEVLWIGGVALVRDACRICY